jgi:hypothetical protein
MDNMKGNNQGANGPHISIHFHPLNFDKKEHAVEKAEGGIKRKYLRGISSGIMKDGHGERMTEHCIQSMMDQGNSGNVLLYAGLHGVNFIDDLGILRTSEIDNGNWITEYQLYDENDNDNISRNSIEKSKQLWAQINGLPPYKYPVQKGFSIEGVVPENQILAKVVNPDGSWTNRVINDMQLDGTVVVNRPAYKDSFVTAVYKCLGELHPDAKLKLSKSYQGCLANTLKENEEKRNFYQKFFEINSTLEQKISDIMKISDGRESERLNILFDEYRAIMVGLILQNVDIFREDTIEASGEIQPPDMIVTEKAQLLMKQLAFDARQFSSIILNRIGGK